MRGTDEDKKRLDGGGLNIERLPRELSQAGVTRVEEISHGRPSTPAPQFLFTSGQPLRENVGRSGRATEASLLLVQGPSGIDGHFIA